MYYIIVKVTEFASSVHYNLNIAVGFNIGFPYFFDFINIDRFNFNSFYSFYHVMVVYLYLMFSVLIFVFLVVVENCFKMFSFYNY